MSDPLTLMQSILDAYHTWKEAPTVDNWIVLDRALDRAAKLLQEVETRLTQVPRSQTASATCASAFNNTAPLPPTTPLPTPKGKDERTR